MNTFYNKKQNRRWTWHSPDFETLNEIDHILIDKSNIVKNVEVINRIGIGSDHRMVRCRVQVDAKQERQKLLRIPEQFKNEFKLDLQNRFAVLEELQGGNNNGVNVNDLNNNIIEPMIAAGKTWKSSSKRVEKFSEETKNLMDKRRNLNAPTNAREKIELAELNKLIRKKQREDLRKHRTTTTQEIIKQGKGFKMAKQKLNQGRLQFTGVREEDGTLTTDRDRSDQSPRIL
ncbi:uncharacterized protein LOC122244004 [Penaeus japonicus]|uniref:uncharacterized protein LOC122244004 n=1 Tax=Penaeus japonicus TaxID=27405 RepID=UPI001C71709C|nr:uncharacterized protein LOC122244004 [Penaeus japonicus]